MMFLFSYNHEEFDRYAEDHINVVLNIANVLLYLTREALTVADISKKINTPDRRERKRSVYDVYALIARLEKWGYIQKEKNANKNNSNAFFCVLTAEGRELLSIMPRYLLQGAKLYYNLYHVYDKEGYIS